MNRLTILATGLSLCTALSAQGEITSPAGGLKSEGRDYSYYLGRYAEARYQFADGENKGKAYSITEVGYRLDNRVHDSYTGMGRSWTNVTLNMSETTNFDKMDRTWSMNVTGTPTTVFSGAVTWETQTGAPLLKPDVWGGLKGKLRFPFTKPWVYTGKDDMLLDYTFAGGKLANAGTWSGSRSASYYLDGEYISTISNGGLIERLPATRPATACNDSAITSTSAHSYTYGSVYAYGQLASEITLRGKVKMYHYSYYTAPDAPVMHALSPFGNTNGVNVGARCNKLYIDAQKPFIPMVFKTIKGNTSGYSGQMAYVVPWNQSMSGMELYLQAGWTDSATGAFSLTQGLKMTFPKNLPPAELPRRKMGYYYTASNATASTITTSSYANPFVRYKTK